MLNPDDTISNRTPGFHGFSCRKRCPKAWLYVHLWAISNDFWRIRKIVIRRFAGERYQWISQEVTKWWRNLWTMWKLAQRLEATNNQMDKMTYSCSLNGLWTKRLWWYELRLHMDSPTWTTFAKHYIPQSLKLFCKNFFNICSWA